MSEWTKDTPTKEGYYYFVSSRLHLGAEIVRVVGHPLVVERFAYDGKAPSVSSTLFAGGWWKPVPVPRLPKEIAG